MVMALQKVKAFCLPRKWVILLFLLLPFFGPGCAEKRVRLGEPIPEIRVAIIRAAVDAMGKPYRTGGRGPDQFDCSGLVYFAYKKIGVTLPVTAEEQAGAGVSVSTDGALPGDVAVFRIDRSYHVGIMINGADFIHASKSRGVAVDSLSIPYWTKSLQGFRSFLQAER